MTAPLTIRLHPADNVVVARMDILPGTAVEGEVAAATRVPPGHKILTRAVKKGEPLRKYNQIIGFATEDLAPGTHIHTHNCVMADFANIDGVVPLTHGGGCGMAASGLEMDVLRRTLAGYVRHPNMAAVVVLGLGCEANQISGLMNAEGLKEGRSEE